MFHMVVDWSAVSSHPVLRERRLNALRAWDGTFHRRVSLEMPLIHRWARSLDRGSAEGFAPFTVRSTRNPRARIVSTETSPVDVLRTQGVDVRWNAPPTAAKPVETRGRHVDVSLTRDAKRTDERRATLRAGQRAPEATRGKTCVEVGRIAGRLPPSAMALPGAPYKGGSTINDGEGLACSLEHEASWSALCEANAHHEAMSAELTFAEDAHAINAGTAAMVRGAQARLKTAMARLERAQARYDAACERWALLSRVRAEDARDADARALSRELKRQASSVNVNPDKGITPMNTRSHRGKGRAMPPVERR